MGRCNNRPATPKDDGPIVLLAAATDVVGKALIQQLVYPCGIRRPPLRLADHVADRDQ